MLFKKNLQKKERNFWKILQTRLLFVSITYIVFCIGLVNTPMNSYFTFFLLWLLLPLLKMVGMPEIDVLEVGMGGRTGMH